MFLNSESLVRFIIPFFVTMVIKCSSSSSEAGNIIVIFSFGIRGRIFIIFIPFEVRLPSGISYALMRYILPRFENSIM